jgi:hypothetical protein
VSLAFALCFLQLHCWAATPHADTSHTTALDPKTPGYEEERPCYNYSIFSARSNK